MAEANFEAALALLFAHEGGYADHPSDPGGPTKYGITLATYRRHTKPDAMAADVRAMRREEAAAIYRADYWDALRCDALPAGLDYALFDYGVNSGPSRAVRELQGLLGLAANGRMTQALVAASCRADAADLVARLCERRLAFLKGLKTWPVFGAGWSRRVAEVKAAALVMAAAPAPAASNASAGKVVAATVAAAVAAGGAQAIQHGSARVALAVAVLVLLAVAGFVIWRRRKGASQDIGNPRQRGVSS